MSINRASSGTLEYLRGKFLLLTFALVGEMGSNLYGLLLKTLF
jgi:hypothetical protein